jgi:GT2 family glycosyltransferase
MMAAPPRLTLSVCILNWNGRAYLEDCLRALYAQDYPPDDVLVVDNGSTDDSIPFLRERFPALAIHETGGNLGYAAGNNVALRRPAADVVFLLNPDVVLSPGCLAAVVTALAGDPSIGVAGCKLWYPGDRLLQHAGGYVAHPQAFPGHFGIGERDEGQHDAPRDVDYVIGAAVAVRRELVERIGPLDEGYFLYFEDADFCARARRAGFRVTYLPQATAAHVESALTVKGSFAYLHRFHTGRWRYLLKHFTAGELLEATLPAERAWLERSDAGERRAAALAYVATLRGLPGIWAARERAGATPVAPAEQEALRAGLAGLRARAREGEFDPAALSRLAATATIEERPFRSDAPLLGPLIARIRAAWNDVASRWYVGHVVTQQNEFNRLAVEQVAAYEAELREQMELLEEQAAVTAELQQRVQELQALLFDLARDAAGDQRAKA